MDAAGQERLDEPGVGRRIALGPVADRADARRFADGRVDDRAALADGQPRRRGLEADGQAGRDPLQLG